jgi:Fe-S-cluster containining protein
LSAHFQQEFARIAMACDNAVSVFVRVARFVCRAASDLRHAREMASGLRHLSFRCTACANCCKDLRVPLTSADVRRLVEHTGHAAAQIVDWLPTGEVDLTGEPGSLVLLGAAQRVLMTLAQESGACLFLAPDASCRAYEARPASCRLYPFDASFGPRGGVRRLRLLGGTRCDYARDGHNDPHALREADAQRWAEHRAYLAQVSAWNRSQGHRQRFGRRALGSREFLGFLGLGE